MIAAVCLYRDSFLERPFLVSVILHSLVCVGQESYHHVDKKNNPHDKKGPKQKFSECH